ncbi:asparagine synthase-related protein [Clostridium sp. SM-530-WT-3G]|uniref:asparagine synthase-related protein n=1 Tax=Clostridium sp. SM-530-WT-3G TaxID=2725303 RepID=UPI00145D3415|nr:asparagine synthase-related protein [Clostridium sp. SM-530-WT-3G]NME83417.1 hypothetical protein [Clostridium sp. SM-530-WT-3G]
MSGLISGAINFDKDTFDFIKKVNLNTFNTYKIDNLRMFDDEKIFMLCGQQYITKEDTYEKMPFYDENSKLLINGDIILDNRKDLCEIFGISKEDSFFVPDSILILEAYKKWNYNCPNHLLGNFAFVIVDKNNNEIFCARDHMGCRPLYYYYDKEKFAFSTISNVLLPFTHRGLNERWITDFMAILGPLNNSEPLETIYNDIFQLPPAHIMIIKNNKMVKKKYWDPIKEVKPLKLKSHEEYVEKFLDIFKEAINCRLRTSYDVGIMISGGLDSSSVAALASRKLEEEGKRLKGYSFVPMKGYAEKSKSRRMVDESEYVKLIENFCGNIDVEFCMNEGLNSISNIDELINMYEQPIKTLENSYWITEIVKKCSENNIKILLSGQFGNGTISFGDFFIHMDSLLKDHKISEIIKEVNCAAEKYSVSKKDIYKLILKNEIPYNIKKLIYKKYNTVEARFGYTPVNPKLIDKWNVVERFDESEYNLIIPIFSGIDKYRKKLLSETSLSHIAIMEVKDSLKYGVIKRDPTRDKRIVEFCLSLPSEVFVHNGEERYLIRSSMKGILPEKIRTNWKNRGIQSADWVERLIPEWNNIYAQIKEALQDDEIVKYIDVPKVNKYLDKYKGITDTCDKQEIKCLLIVLVLYKFFIQYREKIELSLGQN